MNSRLALTLTGAAMAAALTAWTIATVRRWRSKSPDEIERLRRLDIHRRGRITHGYLVDVIEAAPDSADRTTIVYSYEVAGVNYEVGQDISSFPSIIAAARSLPGHDGLIKYDPKQPSNSIVTCEDWSGIRQIDPLIH